MIRPLGFLAALVVAMAIVGTASAGHIPITNGDFSDGLTGWSVESESPPMVFVHEGALNLFAGSPGSPTYVSQTFKAGGGGGVFSFDWFFQANDFMPYNDTSFFSIDGTSGFLADVASVGNFGSSGWNSFAIPLSAGWHDIGFGIVNVGDTVFPSLLTLDNIAFVKNSKLPGSVPEPGTLALLGAGLLGTFIVRRRKSVI